MISAKADEASGASVSSKNSASATAVAEHTTIADRASMRISDSDRAAISAASAISQTFLLPFGRGGQVSLAAHILVGRWRGPMKPTRSASGVALRELAA
jgi:hypothetical protein